VTVLLPQGFHSHVTNIGIKDSTDDFTLVRTEGPCSAAGVFTQSRFAGPSVIVSRRHVANHRAHAVVVISKNANVANGQAGMNDAMEVVEGVANALGCAAEDVLIASTGVIGRRYPMDRVRAGLMNLPNNPHDVDALAVARGIIDRKSDV